MLNNVKKTAALLMGLIMSTTAVFGSNVIRLEASEERILPKEPVYDANTDTTQWDYVYFGSYPQTELSGEAVTEAIVNASYDTYGDAEVDGQKYRRMKASDAYYSSNVVVEGFYSWTGKDYVYFKYEPIKWRVLDVDDESLFLMADSVLDCRKYSNHDNAVTWAASASRNWLNGYGPYGEGKTSFIHTAFTAEEQSAIIQTNVADSDNLLHKTDGGEDTQDKIFLMSIRELVNEDYGFSSDFMQYSNTRQIKPTDYAFANGIWMSSYNQQYGDYCWWLLRSPGAYGQAVSLVYRFGNIYQDGYYADTPYYGTCPALKVDIDSTEWTLVEEPVQKLLSVSAHNDADVVTGNTDNSDAAMITAGNGTIWGDADYDTTVTLADAQLVLKAALKIIDDATMPQTCDVDGEEGISLADAQLILKYALKIITEFPDLIIPEVSEAPSATGSAAGTAPEVSQEPISSIRPSTEPVRPTLPPEEPYTPAPEKSEEPLVQESHDPSGVMWIAADSIAVEYNSGKGRGLCGWGEVLWEYFNDDIMINNKAIGGRSSKSFTKESNYGDIIEGMEKGDYLFISFGHNDERASVDLYTDPYGDSSTERSYKWYLKEYYIDPAIRAGVQPVLVSPVARRYFYEGELINPQLHTPYAKAMEELVQEYADMGMTVYYIDLHTKMLNLYEELGEAGTESLHAANDTTHLCWAGAEVVCDYMVEEMQKQNMDISSFLK